MEENKITPMEEVQESKWLDSVPEAICWIRATLKGSFHLTDSEVDDIATMAACEQADIHPNISMVLTTPRKDFEALTLKLTTMGCWLNGPFGSKTNLITDMNYPPALPNFYKQVKTHCVDPITKRLKIFSTAPSAKMFNALLQNQELAALPWDVVCYTGAYNIQVNEQVNFLTTLYKKLTSGDGSRMYMAQWYTGMGQGKDPRLRNLSSLLNEKDWQYINKENPSLVRYIENLLFVFNKNLIMPDNLFDDGKQGTKTTPTTVIEAAKKVWESGCYVEYVEFCQSAVIGGIKIWDFVKNKKKGILASVDALVHDAPLADMLIGLVISTKLEKYWKISAGRLVIDNDMLNIAPVDDTPNVFELQLQLSDEAVQAVHDEILNMFCA